MKPLLLACILIFSQSVLSASTDATNPISKIELTLADSHSRMQASITLEYVASPHRDKELISITVNWRGFRAVIPKEELVGLTKMQIDSMQFKYGAYRDGRMYYYIDTRYGSLDRAAEKGFKQVRLLMEGNEFIKRNTFITKPTGTQTSRVIQLSHKLKGKPEKAIENKAKKSQQSKR